MSYAVPPRDDDDDDAVRPATQYGASYFSFFARLVAIVGVTAVINAYIEFHVLEPDLAPATLEPDAYARIHASPVACEQGCRDARAAYWSYEPGKGCRCGGSLR